MGFEVGSKFSPQVFLSHAQCIMDGSLLLTWQRRWHCPLRSTLLFAAKQPWGSCKRQSYKTDVLILMNSSLGTCGRGPQCLFVPRRGQAAASIILSKIKQLQIQSSDLPLCAAQQCSVCGSESIPRGWISSGR